MRSHNIKCESGEDAKWTALNFPYTKLEYYPSLAEYINVYEVKLHPVHVLDMLLQICQLLNDMRLRGMLTDNITLENFRINEFTGVIHFESVKAAKFSSSLSLFRNAAGVVMGELFGIVDSERKILIPNYALKLLHNRDVSYQMIQLISELMDKNNDKRISYAAVISVLHKMQAQYHNKPLLVSVVDLAKYDAMNDVDKNAVIQKIAASSFEVIMQSPEEYQCSDAVLALICNPQLRGIRIWINKTFNDLVSLERDITRVLIKNVMPLKMGFRFGLYNNVLSEARDRVVNEKVFKRKID